MKRPHCRLWVLKRERTGQGGLHHRLTYTVSASWNMQVWAGDAAHFCGADVFGFVRAVTLWKTSFLECYSEKFQRESSQMDKKWAGCHCTQVSVVNIANSVLTPTQAILILMLPLSQTIYLSKFTPSHCLKRQRGPLSNRIWMLSNDWWLGFWYECLQFLWLCFIAFIQCPYWLKFKIQVNTETFLNL